MLGNLHVRFGVGAGLKFPGLHHVVANLATGELKFDDFNGRWGDRSHLDAFLQAYACEKAKSEARRRGHQCTEQTLADGSVKLTILVQGGAA